MQAINEALDRFGLFKDQQIRVLRQVKNWFADQWLENLQVGVDRCGRCRLQLMF